MGPAAMAAHQQPSSQPLGGGGTTASVQAANKAVPSLGSHSGHLQRNSTSKNHDGRRTCRPNVYDARPTRKDRPWPTMALELASATPAGASTPSKYSAPKQQQRLAAILRASTNMQQQQQHVPQLADTASAEEQPQPQQQQRNSGGRPPQLCRTTPLPSCRAHLCTCSPHRRR